MFISGGVKMHERFISTKNNITWHIYESGQDNKDTIFLIAGFPQSAYA